MTSLVTARGVSKHFGAVRAVDDVSFDIEKGRILGLIGPNGAGKTTLLKALLGLTECDGDLSVLGLDPFKQRKQLMQNICFIADVAVFNIALALPEQLVDVAAVPALGVPEERVVALIRPAAFEAVEHRHELAVRAECVGAMLLGGRQVRGRCRGDGPCDNDTYTLYHARVSGVETRTTRIMPASMW